MLRFMWVMAGWTLMDKLISLPNTGRSIILKPLGNTLLTLYGERNESWSGQASWSS